MAEKIVIALGGNALQSGNMDPTAEAQLKVVQKTCSHIADISLMGYEVGIVHGNGPQVGRILLASETAKDVTPVMPFDVCGAMSQGYIGYHIQQSLRQALIDRGRNIPVVTIVTRVKVDKDDPAFQNPSKPIGPFYTEEEAKELAEKKGYTIKEDAGRGWRRVVPSPAPKEILEVHAFKTLWPTTITVAVGGGGIPVVENDAGDYEGVAAVIDKDYAAELLAENIDADYLMILTEVDKVAINFNTPDQKDLDTITVSQAEKYIEEGHFAPGSMLPKVEAAVKFVKYNPKGKAIITSLDKATDALEGKDGTLIVAG